MFLNRYLSSLDLKFASTMKLVWWYWLISQRMVTRLRIARQLLMVIGSRQCWHFVCFIASLIIICSECDLSVPNFRTAALYLNESLLYWQKQSNVIFSFLFLIKYWIHAQLIINQTFEKGLSYFTAASIVGWLVGILLETS